MRELVATFYGNELLFGLILMVWLAWVAVGSWGLARLTENRRLGVGSFSTGLFLAGILVPVQMILVRNARTLLGITPGAFVEFGPMVGVVVTLLAPLCLLTGLLFTLGTRLTVEGGGSAGQAYVWESVGAVAGGALFSFILLRWLDPFQTALMVVGADLVVAIGLLIPSSTSRVKFPVSLFSFILLTMATLPIGSRLHQATLSKQWEDLIYTADSPYGRLTIQARDGQRIFFENGLMTFETQGTFPEEVAHFPLLTHPDPSSVLLIGGGVAGNLREILKHPIDNITYVELDPLLIEAAMTNLPLEDVAILHDPRVTLILTDGRLYVHQVAESTKETASRNFDIVILDLPEPATGSLNRFYTYQFFTEVNSILNPDGVFALGLPSAENYWSPELARRNGSVFHTLKAVFPNVVVLPGEHNFFLASDVPLETNPIALTERLTERAIETLWVTPTYLKYIYTTDRFIDVRQELDATGDVRLNHDLKPICYYYDLALWLSRFYPNLRGVFDRAGLVNLWWVAVPLVIIVMLLRWRRELAVVTTIAGIGLAEMTLQVVILFAFQVLHGYLYAEVSLIVTAFMAGLALGSAGSNRLLARCSPSSSKRAKQILIAVQIAIIIYCSLFPFILSSPIPAPTLVFPLLALLAGFLTGMAFPLALALTQTNTSRAAGTLYGADLVGGCLGALIGAGLFIPVLGIPQTCVAIVLVGLAGLLALVK